MNATVSRSLATVCAGVLALFAAPLAPAQLPNASAQQTTQPDLDGNWNLNTAKSRIAKHGPSHGDTLRIESSAEYLIISENIGGGEVTRTYNTNGKVTPVARVSGGAVMAKAYWKKSVLVIETFGVQSQPSPLATAPNPRAPGNPAPDFATNEHTVQRLTISSDGKTLTRDFGKGDDLLVYDEEQ
jgi:hypothetical protein